MRVELEDFVPYDQSLLWRIGREYYARRGIAAWTEGELPYGGTNNAAFARQHAQFFAGIASKAAPARGPIHVLEIGSGLGQFAPLFLRALREECGPRGRKLAERVRFVLSDVAEKTVREAIATVAVRDLVAAGRVVPALFDLREPTVRTLDGEPLGATFAMVLANYVCDVTPVSVFRKIGPEFVEKYARARLEVTDGETPSREALVEGLLDRSGEPGLLGTVEIEAEWRPVDLDARLPAEQADALRALVSSFGEATVPWFGAFLDRIGHLPMRPGGALVVNDYGEAAVGGLRGLGDANGRWYGNSWSHSVSLAIFDAYSERIGLHALRSLDPFRSLHTAAVVFGPLSAAHRDAFREAFVDQEPCEDLLDFVEAGRAAAERKKHLLAIRLFRRALALEPRSAELHYRIGEACLDALRNDDALEYLSAGQALDRAHTWDFAFQLGRACHRAGRLAESLDWYRRSLAREDHPATRFDLALVYRDLGKIEDALTECREALRLTPGYEHAERLLGELQAGATPGG